MHGKVFNMYLEVERTGIPSTKGQAGYFVLDMSSITFSYRTSSPQVTWPRREHFSNFGNSVHASQ
jgi:hypothetical protein